MAEWNAAQLDRIRAAGELKIATRRADGSLRGWVKVWVVVAEEQAYVRTWRRRDTGWFGHAVQGGCARIRVPGLEVDVTVEDVGAAVRAPVDAAYQQKYGSFGAGSVDRMVTDDAAATTLRLSRE